MDALSLFSSRRSASANKLGGPGPSPQQLRKILTIASRVPDHRMLAPWRFIVFEGEARKAFGEALARALVAEEKEAPSDMRLNTERQRLLRAPHVVALISSPKIDQKATPEWEQVLSCGAAGMNLCLAANAMGFGTAWITEWYSYSPAIRKTLGLAPQEKVAGFIYIGTVLEPQGDRDRPRLEDIVTEWKG
ncbi:MAG: nitroreductase [Hyphomicrobiaceae bacterium]|nr:MAG: nitroreductase [Hyphomicrobiaceae bacterium]